MSKSVSISDQRNLADIFDDTNEFGSGNANSIRLFLTMAGLDKFKNGLQLTGVPRTDAFLVVQTLESHKQLENAPDYDALGMMLEYVLSLPELSIDKKTFMAKTIVVHGLIRKEAVIDELCEKYAITKPDVIEEDKQEESTNDAGDLPIPYVKLKGKQQKELLDALQEAFSYDEFKEFLALNLDSNIQSISLAGDFRGVAFDVIGDSQRKGWTGEFLTALRDEGPEHPDIKTFLKNNIL